VRLKELLYILRRECAGRLAVTGLAGAAIAPERFRLEESFALTDGISLRGCGHPDAQEYHDKRTQKIDGLLHTIPPTMYRGAAWPEAP